MIRQDKNDKFRFAALQSATGKKLLEEYHQQTEEIDSVVLIDKGKIYKKSTAALKAMNYLPWYFKQLQILRIVPAFIRDAIYDLIARNRYKWFGKTEECMVPNADVRAKFLE